MASAGERQGELSHLAGPSAGLGQVAARPHLVVAAAILLLVLLSWLALSAMTLGAGWSGGYGSLGPGMAALGRALEGSTLGAPLLAVLADSGLLPLLGLLCSFTPDGWAIGDFGLAFATWLVMALAMMTPSAAPMLRTYSEIADTAAARGQPIVSPFVLAAGYFAVWAGFALLAAALQAGIATLGLAAGAGPLGPLFGGGVLVAAGLYQLTALKHACLIRCASPFPYLFANWTQARAGVFRLGVRQGIFCLGCCWAMMLTMFALGVMNIFWVVVLTVLATAEKMVMRPWLSRALGGGFVALGLGMMSPALIAQG